MSSCAAKASLFPAMWHGARVQQHIDGTLSIPTPHLMQQRMKVFLSHVRRTQADAMSGAEVDRRKENSFSIPARDWKMCLLAAQRPGAAQHGKQPQDGFVFHDEHGVSRNRL